MTRWWSIVTLAALTCAACGGEDDPLKLSCAGEAIVDCRPYEYSVVTAATLTPDEVEVGDPGASVTVHVEIDHCGSRSPQPHRVALSARATASGGVDAGASERVFPLGELFDNGSTGGDATALDGVIDATLPNPFFGDLPTETDMVLRFTPRIDTCEGEHFEIPYRTGPMWVRPPPPP